MGDLLTTHLKALVKSSFCIRWKDYISTLTDATVNVEDKRHPVVWTNERKKAKNVYFQFGHSTSLFSNPAFVKMFENAIRWAL